MLGQRKGAVGIRLHRLVSLSSFPGVLLDIQQHFGVKDRGAGLLQSGKSSYP